MLTPERRKWRTEAILRKKGIPILDTLPVTESEDEVELRDLADVGTRILCLYAFVGTAFEPGDDCFIKYLKDNDLWKHLSEDEEIYLADPTKHDRVRINATWRLEALYFLVWAVGIIEALPWPDHQSSSADFIEFMPKFDDSSDSFLAILKLRSVGEIMEASDLIYRLHWAARQYNNEVDFDGGIVQEWHHAVNWLTNYDCEKWDYVATDT